MLSLFSVILQLLITSSAKEILMQAQMFTTSVHIKISSKYSELIHAYGFYLLQLHHLKQPTV